MRRWNEVVCWTVLMQTVIASAGEWRDVEISDDTMADAMFAMRNVWRSLSGRFTWGRTVEGYTWKIEVSKCIGCLWPFTKYTNTSSTTEYCWHFILQFPAAARRTVLPAHSYLSHNPMLPVGGQSRRKKSWYRSGRLERRDFVDVNEAWASIVCRHTLAACIEKVPGVKRDEFVYTFPLFSDLCRTTKRQWGRSSSEARAWK